MRKSLLTVVPAAAVVAVMFLPFLAGDVDVYTVHTEVATDGTTVRTPRVTSVSQLRRQQSAPGPRAQVDTSVHDFGRMAPLTVREHAFVIRNVGDAPLELTEGPTTCKCTLFKLREKSVPPGGKTQVVVQWNSGRDPAYAHSATIYTNDPRSPVVRLSIKGTVQTVFRCTPEQLVFSRVAPDESPSATVVVYSQVWDDIELEPIVPALEGMICSVDDVEPAAATTLQARSARRITVTLPPDLPEGYFTTSLALRGRPRGGAPDQSAECELMVRGKVIRRLCVYGPEIDVYGTVDMGRVRQGRGAHVRLLLKVRDAERALPVKHIETDPEFLRVWVEPGPVDNPEELGLYYLHIEVPKDAPTFRLPPTRRAMIHLEFDHPRVPTLDLPLDLIVIPRDGA